MTTPELVLSSMIAVAAIVAPLTAATLYRIRQLEIRVMNGLSEEVKSTGLKVDEILQWIAKQ